MAVKFGSLIGRMGGKIEKRDCCSFIRYIHAYIRSEKLRFCVDFGSKLDWSRV